VARDIGVAVLGQSITVSARHRRGDFSGASSPAISDTPVNGEQRGEDRGSGVDAGVLVTPLGRWSVTTQVAFWPLRQNLVMVRWKLAMLAAQRGPGLKLTSTKSTPA
jgi:hypothetical protein